MKFIDRTGSKFERWTVLSFSHRNSAGSASWNCQCECGSLGKVLGSNLTSGSSTSCGCWKKEQAVTHGMTRHPAFRVFCAAKDRCTREGNKQYQDYGGRGIKFLFTSFEEFWEELKETYKEGLTLERIDNNKNYESGNVKWATRVQQANNKRNNVWFEYSGEKKTQAQWAKHFKVTDQLIANALKRMTVKQLFSNLERNINE